MSWLAEAEYKQGSKNEKMNKDCQDYAEYSLLPDGTLITCLSDGAGSSDYAKEAAQLVVMKSIQYFKDLDLNKLDLDELNLTSGLTKQQEGQLLLEKTCSSLIQKLQNELKKLEKDKNCEREHVCCTLLLAISSKNYFAACHCGDGAIVYHLDDHPASVCQLAFSPEKSKENASSTNFINSFTNIDQFVRNRCIYIAQKVDFVFLTSDGMENLILRRTRDQFTPENGFFEPLIEWITNKTRKRVAREIKNFFKKAEQETDDDDFCITDDDMSCVIGWTSKNNESPNIQISENTTTNVSPDLPSFVTQEYLSHLDFHQSSSQEKDVKPQVISSQVITESPSKVQPKNKNGYTLAHIKKFIEKPINLNILSLLIFLSFAGLLAGLWYASDRKNSNQNSYTYESNKILNSEQKTMPNTVSNIETVLGNELFYSIETPSIDNSQTKIPVAFLPKAKNSDGKAEIIALIYVNKAILDSRNSNIAFTRIQKSDRPSFLPIYESEKSASKIEIGYLFIVNKDYKFEPNTMVNDIELSKDPNLRGVKIKLFPPKLINQ